MRTKKQFPAPSYFLRLFSNFYTCIIKIYYLYFLFSTLLHDNNDHILFFTRRMLFTPYSPYSVKVCVWDSRKTGVSTKLRGGLHRLHLKELQECIVIFWSSPCCTQTLVEFNIQQLSDELNEKKLFLFLIPVLWIKYTCVYLVMWTLTQHTCDIISRL